ncbi:MAG: DUF4215 domain-containing protein [Pseudomonadota bacterium]|nr:DUF4215 domain-containing protein [Pseudomonadota bacterium]
MGLSNTEQKRNSGLISAGLVMLLVLATPLAYAQDPICGDGIFNPDNNEQCDDGNNVEGDGCSSTCQNEPLPPVASDVAITGTPQVGQVLTGNYTYSDTEGDLEGASTFRWLRGDTPIAGATARTYTLVVADEGALITFEVTPVAQSGTSPGVPATSDAVRPVVPPINLPPTASNVLISGNPRVGQVLTASYDYFDAENDPQGASTFRWLHTDGEVDTPIDGATAPTYTLVAADEGALIKFEVTPVAQSGISPGLAASAVVGPVVTPELHPSTPPTASNVLISGNPRVGQVLTGSYTYADAEGDLQGTSIFRWLRDNVAIPGATARSYALVAADEGTLIRFEVTPVAQSGPSPGLAVASAEVGPVTPAPNDRTTASDLELISLTATPDSLTVNGQLTYTIKVRNNGPATATGVHVINALPPGAAPVPAEGPADSSQGQCSGTPSSGPPPQALTVQCDLIEPLPPSAEATVTINVMPTVAGDLINTAQVAAFGTDPNLANNSKTVTTTVRLQVPELADLAVTAAVGPRASGQGFTYTLTVTNHGLATATRVQLTNDLPRDVDFVSFAVSQGSCIGIDPMLCDLGTLTSGAVATVTIDVVIRTDVEPDTLPNRVQVNADQDDPDRANNFASTSALELSRPQTACNSARCTLRLTCNRSGFLRGICENEIKLFVDTPARRDTRTGRLSDERAARPPRVRFAAGIGNLTGDQTANVRLQITQKGKKLAGTLIQRGKKTVRGVMEIKNHVGGMGTDRIRVKVRLK